MPGSVRRHRRPSITKYRASSPLDDGAAALRARGALASPALVSLAVARERRSRAASGCWAARASADGLRGVTAPGSPRVWPASPARVLSDRRAASAGTPGSARRASLAAGLWGTRFLRRRRPQPPRAKRARRASLEHGLRDRLSVRVARTVFGKAITIPRATCLASALDGGRALPLDWSQLLPDGRTQPLPKYPFHCPRFWPGAVRSSARAAHQP